MFQQGEYVVYSDTGLCLVEQIGVPDFSVSDRNVPYYFLRSTEDGSRIYVPVDTRIPMRAPMTSAEAEQLLSSLPDLPVSPPGSRDRKAVVQHYQAMLRPHTSQALAQTVKSIHCCRRSMPGRMGSAEETLLKRAEHQLCSELACALHLSEADASARLTAALSQSREN